MSMGARVLQALSDAQMADLPRPLRARMNSGDLEELREEILASLTTVTVGDDEPVPLRTDEPFGSYMGIPLWIDDSVPSGEIVVEPVRG